MTTGEKELIKKKEKSLLIEKEGKNRFELETFISKIPSRFRGDIEFNDAIDSLLRDIGISSDTDRTFLFLFNKEKTTMSNTNEWCAGGINSQKKYLQNLKLNVFPWWIGQLKKGKIISTNDISNLPENARSIKELFINCYYNSLLVSPIYVNEILLYLYSA